MHRLLQNALVKKKFEYTPRLIRTLHRDIWLNFTPNRTSIAIELVEAGDIQGLAAALACEPSLLMLPNDLGFTPLTTASVNNEIEIIKFLMEKGCKFSSELHQQVILGVLTLNKKKRLAYLNTAEEAGLLPIDFAVANGSIDIVNLLQNDMKNENIDIDYFRLLKIALLNAHQHLLSIIVPHVS